MKVFNALAVSLTVARILFVSQRAEPADWPMMGRDATRNGVSPERGGPTDWSVGRYEQETMEWNAASNILWSGQLVTQSEHFLI